MSIQITVSSDPKSQAEYLCFVAKDIVNGCFERGGFSVLPYPVKNHHKAIYFPHLHLSSRFWKYLNSCPHHDLGNAFPPVCVSEILSKLPPLSPVKAPVIPPQFLSDCSHFLDFNLNIDLSILLTPYGSIGSFRSFVKNKKTVLLVTKRSDTSLEIFLRTLLLGFFKIQTRLDGEVDEEWGRQRMAIIDYLLSHTILKKYKPQLVHTPTQKMKLDSQRYLSELGLSSKSCNYSLIDNSLTLQEKALWSCLRNNPDKIISFDDAATAIWQHQSDDKFSLYSLAKIVENIRKKARKQGINHEIITTIRKQGYSHIS